MPSRVLTNEGLPSRVLTTNKGLVTEPGVWTRDPASMTSAFNADFSSPGMLAKRRGLSNNTLSGSFGIYGVASSQTLDQQVGLGGVLIHAGAPGTGFGTGLSFGLRGGAMTAFTGTYGSAANRRMRVTSTTAGTDVVALSQGTADNDSGTLEISTYAAATIPRLGVPRGMGVDRINTTTTGASGFLANNSCCRYAAVFVFGDPTLNGARFGAPGMTSVVTNTAGGSRDITGRVLLPWMVGTASTTLPTSGVFLQLYRSATQATSLGEPPSELALVYQKEIDATDVANGYVSFTDATTDALRGANLYTNLNTGEDGIAGRGFINSNEPAPGASDCVTWADCLWLSELVDYPTQEFQCIAVGGSGLVAADTVTVSGVVFTAIAPGVPAANQFVVVTTGTASFNQRETSLNLCDAINRSASNTDCYAYYVSGVAGQPGRIQLWGRQQQSSLGVSTSRAAAFRIGTSSGSAVSPSAVSFSKALQPWAHPFVNRFEMGRQDAAVLRIIPYRESLFVFKADGIWRITGSDFTNFTAQEFDLTFRLLCRDSVVMLDDAIYAWGVQGIARVTDTGVEYVSLPIQQTVTRALKSVSEARIGTFAFAVANQREGWVAFFYPTTDGNGTQFLACASALVWYARTRCWARWVFPNASSDTAIGYASGAANVTDGLMTLGVWQAAPASGAWLHNERRTYTSTDFSDPSMTSSGSPTMSATAISLSLTWQPIGSEALGAAQWVRGRFDFPPSDGTRGGDPGACTVLFSSEQTFGASQSVTAQLGGLGSAPGVLVAPVDQEVSRSHALEVSFTHSTVSLGCWLVAAAVDFRPYSVKGVSR